MADAISHRLLHWSIGSALIMTAHRTKYRENEGGCGTL